MAPRRQQAEPAAQTASVGGDPGLENPPVFTEAVGPEQDRSHRVPGQERTEGAETPDSARTPLQVVAGQFVDVENTIGSLLRTPGAADEEISGAESDLWSPRGDPSGAFVSQGFEFRPEAAGVLGLSSPLDPEPGRSPAPPPATPEAKARAPVTVGQWARKIFFDLAVRMGLVDEPKKEIALPPMPRPGARRSHPYFGPVIHGQWELLDAYGLRMESFVHGPYLLDDFDPRIVANPRKTVAEMISMVQPLHAENGRFSDLGAIEGAKTAPMKATPNNVNPDLGLQRQIRRMIERGIIGSDTFVLMSNGHAIAGLAALAAAVTPDGKYMFDTAVYFPRGGWGADNEHVQVALGAQFQLWSEELRRVKEEHLRGARPWAGGMAVSLWGHRGRWDPGTSSPAHIDPYRWLGRPEEFLAYLDRQGLRRVVVITEEYVEDPDADNFLELDSLDNGAFGNENQDLIAYMRELIERGVPVRVISGDIRSPNIMEQR